MNATFQAGIILGPSLTGVKDGLFLKKTTFPRQEILLSIVWAYIGMINLVFLVAVKMDLSIIRKNLKNASFIGLTSVFCSHFVMSALTSAIHPVETDKTSFPGSGNKNVQREIYIISCIIISSSCIINKYITCITYYDRINLLKEKNPLCIYN